VAAKIPYLRAWNTPVDGGATFRGKPLLGKNKTWRGFLFGVAAGTLTAWVLYQLYVLNTESLPFIRTDLYMSVNPVLFGILSSIGALAGDAVESFAKRQLSIPSGSTWFPFDQLDYIAGGIVLTFWFAPLPFSLYLLAFVVAFLSHLGASYIGYSIGIKEKPI
jgi:CDP-2,3-bis-(O-geranylgeranyl)-sn-glycerol synthase